jgi:SAM-dependent methyltransferase
MSSITAELGFPLNLYARALELEEGAVESLHYGLDPVRGSMAEAQQRMSEFLFERLPPPCRLLEVGVGLCTSAAELAGRGYDYSGVTPDPSQVKRCRTRGLSITENYFERMPKPEQPFDLILFQESAQYIHPAALLTQAREMLRPTGRLIICDEIDSSVAEGAQSLIESLGFHLLSTEDITSRAAPSLSILIEMLYDHRKAVVDSLPSVEPIHFARLMVSLEERRSAYLSGRHLYKYIEVERRG